MAGQIKILFIGDIVAGIGRRAVRTILSELRKEKRSVL